MNDITDVIDEYVTIMSVFDLKKILNQRVARQRLQEIL